MCVCVCVCVRALIHMCVCFFEHVRLSVCLFAYLSVHLSVRSFPSPSVRPSVRLSVCLSVWLCSPTCVYDFRVSHHKGANQAVCGCDLGLLRLLDWSAPAWLEQVLPQCYCNGAGIIAVLQYWSGYYRSATIMERVSLQCYNIGAGITAVLL